MLESFIQLVHSFLPGFLMLIIFVLVHEWGHWVFLRRYGVFIDRFAVGFGKPLFSRIDKNGTKWMFSPILLGGYVSFPYTLNDISEHAKGKVGAGDVFNAKTPFQRMMVMLGGPAVNIILALFLFVGVFFFQGIPTHKVASSSNLISLQKGDVIVSMDGSRLPDTSEEWFRQPFHSLGVQRDGQPVEVVLENDKKSSFSRLGVFMECEDAKTIAAIRYGVKDFIVECQRLSLVIQSLFSGELKNLGGMPTIFKVSIERWEQGWFAFLLFSAMLSLSLGVLNLVPMPGLDGGHILLLVISVVFRKGKPLPAFLEKAIGYVSFAILIGLILFINIRDIYNLKWVKSLWG